ncbi:hypothetical protein TREES_T100016842 [Tupaia chinensis]|uniref:Uncharacterized protein n=1 Tax=Tupaia chinensis TaxID=246437 RepID=L9KYW1_TUPCH|nr:hypothetical protein TREES_T100016842 [Tupaia chinensis]
MLPLSQACGALLLAPSASNSSCRRLTTVREDGLASSIRRDQRPEYGEGIASGVLAPVGTGVLYALVVGFKGAAPC